MTAAIAQRACTKLRSAIEDEAVVRLNFTAYLREMLVVLEAIRPFLYVDFEMQLFTDLERLLGLDCRNFVWQVAYKIMDMVDELQDTATMTRMLPRLVMATKVQQMREWMSICQPGHGQDTMENDKRFFQHITMNQRITGPVLSEASISGRGSDKERIMAVLHLFSARNFTQEPIIILPIFGLAGSGKTTLARIIFSDTHSLQGYDFRVWVHVSLEFDMHKIVESIFCQVFRGGQSQEEAYSDKVGMEHIMKRLHKLLDGKKMLLILDDLWEEDPIQLQLLKSILTFLGDKVDVIVTTCNRAIARKICTIEPYRLSPLSYDKCWEIIKKAIRFEDTSNEESVSLEEVGREIASNCGGLPSAAQAYANFIHHRNATWGDLGKRNIWSAVFSNDTYSHLLSSFELCYRSMPENLRICFVYCAIFPKGHIILKADLIHQWMALQLIEPSDSLSTAQLVEEYITRLLDMSFLQTAKTDNCSGKDDNGVTLFTMHNLAHDFTVMFLRWLGYCIATYHHGRLVMESNYIDLRVLRCIGCRKMEFSGDLFSRNKSLRVLELKESSVQKLPDSIWQLRHLGYLKISEFSGLVTLPESIGHLINLLHIDLSGCSGLLNLPESLGELIRLVHANLTGCSELQNLPESVGKLVNLVHINLSGCSGLATLPGSFGNLMNLSHINLSRCHGLEVLPESLQKLSKLVHLDLSFWSCFEGIGKGLGGLTSLEHLNLSNPCCHLAQQRSHLQGLKDGLCKLTKLRYLNLSACLNPILYYYQSQEESLKYLGECVRGLSSLEHLDLSHHTFLFGLPASLGELNKLHTLDLSGCIRLKKVGEIKSLKYVDLRKCRGLQSCKLVVCVNEGAYSSTSSLAQLEVVDCKELEISCLERLKSLDDARRIRLVEKQKVERLKLCWTVGAVRGSKQVEENALLGELVPPHSLKCLELYGYSGETCLPAWSIPSISSHFRNLIEVTMENFPRCVVLPPLGLFLNLQCLVLRRMARITRIDAGELNGGNKQAFTRLSKLIIDDMENVKEFKFDVVDELAIQKCPLLSFGPLLPRAQRLLISNCDQLMSSSVVGIDGMEGPSAPVTELVVESCNSPLGDWSLLHHLPRLCSLTINNCYNLTSSPEIIRALSSLQSLCFSQCHEPMESLPAFLCDLTSLQQLAIGECHGIKSLPEGMLDRLTRLKSLYVWDCPELKKCCESEENKQKLAHIQLKFEKFDTSKTGMHPPEM